MKKLIGVLALLLLLAVGTAPARAEFKYGPRLGLNVNKLSFDKDLFDGDNQCGFTGGVQIEYIAPAINLGFDLSVMYSYMKMEAELNTPGGNNIGTRTVAKNFIEIPLNLKYKFSIPAVNKIIRPYVFTGPSVAFKLDKGDSYFDTKTTQWTWNFGLGLELIQHLQIGASYGLGMNKIVDGAKVAGITVNADQLKARNNYWTVTAAWLF